VFGISGDVTPEEKFLLSGSADGGIFLWAYHFPENKVIISSISNLLNGFKRN
jgi:hypothetical protein